MTLKLFLNAISKFLLGVVLVGVLIFLPAGSFSFFNGWLLLGILFVSMFIAGIIMCFKNPSLLESRLPTNVILAYIYTKELKRRVECQESSKMTYSTACKTL